MLSVTKDVRGGETYVRLAGTIEGGDVLLDLIGVPAGPLTLDCEAVYRLNSLGIRNWMMYLNILRERKVRVRIENLSVFMVESLNEIQNFLGGAELVSLMLPFLCEQCGTRQDISAKVSSVQEDSVKPIACSKCGGSAGFDNIEEEYFVFVRRKR